MMRRLAGVGLVLALVAGMGTLGAASASGQSTCATKPRKIGSALTAKEAFDLGKAEATQGDADSALLRLMSTGALDAQGRSAAWMIEFFSLAGKKSQSINITKAGMFCNAVVTDAVVSPQFVKENEDTIFDVPRLIRIAREVPGMSMPKCS